MSSSGPTLSHTHGFHNIPRAGSFTVTPASGSAVQQSPGGQQYAMLPRVGNPSSTTSVYPNPNVEREKRRAKLAAAAAAAAPSNSAPVNFSAPPRKRSTRKQSRKRRTRKQRR
jgi:hypothetical protein